MANHFALESSPPHRTVLESLRWQYGLTQATLSARSGVGRATISRIERGAVTRPQRRTAMALAAALEIDVGVLFGPAAEAKRGNGATPPP
jgi:transcriptional regulator with XRE-family HTH domain